MARLPKEKKPPVSAPRRIRTRERVATARQIGDLA